MNIARFPVLLSLLALGAACGDDEGNNPPRGTCTVDEGTPALPPNPPPTPTGNPILVAQVPIPDDYGIHDTFVRDGLAFVLAWDTGLMIYDVGHGVRAGTPQAPVLVSTTTTVNGNAHNGWWFHSPGGEKRYFFVGEEAPASFGSSSAGDIHVLDIANLCDPAEVASYHVSGAGVHNFWMDESSQILYAAYYNAGVVKLDVSGVLTGSLANRDTGPVQIGGSGNTYTWGVQIANGSLFAIDMLSGFWRLDPATLNATGGGNNVTERYSSDLWVHGNYGYTGTWGLRSAAGNTIKIWDVSGTQPVLVDSVQINNINTVSDLQVSDDGTLLVASAEGGSGGGLYVFDVTDPVNPSPAGSYAVSTGLHTVTLGTVAGRLYAFGAKNPLGAALMIFDVTDLLP